MARVQSVIGRAPLDSFFSGHRDSGPRDKEAEERAFRWNHLAFHWDPPGRRLLVIAPHVLGHRSPTKHERHNLEILSEALEGFSELRGGAAGRFCLARTPLDDNDPLFQSTRSWKSLTPYVVTRHARQGSASEALVTDVLAECASSRLPRPDVTVLDIHGVPGSGLEGLVRIEFAVAVAGPIALGRTRYLGGGLFARD